MDQLLQQSRAMQEQMRSLQAGLSAAEVTETAADGLVSVTITAAGDVKQVHIDRSLLDPGSGAALEEYVATAFTRANRAMKQLADESLRPFTQRLEGITDMFSGQ